VQNIKILKKNYDFIRFYVGVKLGIAVSHSKGRTWVKDISELIYEENILTYVIEVNGGGESENFIIINFKT
jgi:hypothetical protein